MSSMCDRYGAVCKRFCVRATPRRILDGEHATVVGAGDLVDVASHCHESVVPWGRLFFQVVNLSFPSDAVPENEEEEKGGSDGRPRSGRMPR